MKHRRDIVMMLLLAGLLVTTGSCDLMTSEAFNDMKEVNLFKKMENIPYYKTDELLSHLRPYGDVQDGVVSFPETGSVTTYRSVYSMGTAFTSAGLVIESFRIVSDITAYIEKVQIMIVNDTLVEFENAGGHPSDLSANLEKIRDKMESLRTSVTTVGFSSSQVETQVIDELNGIKADAEQAIADLGGEVE